MNERKTWKNHNRKKERRTSIYFCYSIDGYVFRLVCGEERLGKGERFLVLVLLFFHCCFSFADEDDDAVE